MRNLSGLRVVAEGPRPREQDDLPAHQCRGLANGRLPAPDWTNVCDSCMSSLPKVRFLSAGTPLLVWRVCSPPPGSLARWDSGSHFAMQGVGSTDSSPRIDIRSASVVAVRATSQNQKQYGGKPDWAHSGRATHWVSSSDCRWSSGRASGLRRKERVFSSGRTTSGSIC